MRLTSRPLISQSLRFTRRLTRDAEGARETVQEAWLAIARGLPRLNDPARFGPWALRITRRRASDWIGRRQRARRHTARLEQAENAEAADSLDDDPQRWVREAIARLEPQLRALMALFYVEGLSVAEIAEVLGIPAGTVKSRLYSGRERLRATLEI